MGNRTSTSTHKNDTKEKKKKTNMWKKDSRKKIKIANLSKFTSYM